MIRPLGFDRDINGVLALEYYAGEEFSHAIARATHHQDDTHLYRRLKALASFLAAQHDRTASGEHVDFGADCRYFDTVAGQAEEDPPDRAGRYRRLSRLRDCWRDRPQMWQDQQVWLHGDATPANFLFGDHMDVAAIDLATDEARRPDVRRRARCGRACARVHAGPAVTGTAPNRSSRISCGSTAVISPTARGRSSLSPPACRTTWR